MSAEQELTACANYSESQIGIFKSDEFWWEDPVYSNMMKHNNQLYRSGIHLKTFLRFTLFLVFPNKILLLLSFWAILNHEGLPVN